MTEYTSVKGVAIIDGVTIDPNKSITTVMDKYLSTDKFDTFCEVNAESMKQLALEIRDLDNEIRKQNRIQQKRNWNHRPNHKNHKWTRFIN